MACFVLYVLSRKATVKLLRYFGVFFVFMHIIDDTGVGDDEMELECVYCRFVIVDKWSSQIVGWVVRKNDGY